MNLRRLGIIASFEFRQRMRSPVLVFMLVLSPLLTIVTTFYPLRHSLHKSTSEHQTQTIGFVDYTEMYGASLSRYFAEHYNSPSGQARFLYVPIQPRELLDNHHFDALLDIRRVNGSVVVQVLSNSTKNEDLGAITAAALDYCTSIHAESVKSIEKAEEGKDESSQVLMLLSLIALNILSMTMSSGTGQLLVRSMFEERQSRLLDVVVSSSSPAEFIFGKYLSIVAVGIVHCVLWITVISIATTQIFDLQFTSIAIVVAIHAFLCFLVFSALYLLLAASIETEASAQSASTLTTLALIIPLTLMLSTVSQHASPVLSVLKWIPLYSGYSLGMSRCLHQDLGTVESILLYAISLGATGLLVMIALRQFTQRTQSGGTYRSVKLK